MKIVIFIYTYSATSIEKTLNDSEPLFICLILKQEKVGL